MPDLMQRWIKQQSLSHRNKVFSLVGRMYHLYRGLILKKVLCEIFVFVNVPRVTAEILDLSSPLQSVFINFLIINSLELCLCAGWPINRPSQWTDSYQFTLFIFDRVWPCWIGLRAPHLLYTWPTLARRRRESRRGGRGIFKSLWINLCVFCW